MRIIEFIHDDNYPVERSNVDLWIEKYSAGKTKKIRINRNEDFPLLHEFDMIIVHGGSQHLWDKDHHLWMYGEIEFIRLALAKGKLVIGFCLGSQIIAEALHSRVYKSKKENGFYTVNTLLLKKEHPLLYGLEDGFKTFMRHSDHYFLPDGCSSLAYTQSAPNQIFVSNRVPAVGFQFHPEYTKEIIQKSIQMGDETKWMFNNEMIGCNEFLNKLEKMPDTFGLFHTLMTNSLTWYHNNYISRESAASIARR